MFHISDHIHHSLRYIKDNQFKNFIKANLSNIMKYDIEFDDSDDGIFFAISMFW